MDNKTRILIVDDEKESRDIIRGVLKQALYEVEEATNGEEALELMRKDPPDLVVLDVRMPKMDGYQVCYEIRNDITIMNIPVIMLTVMGSTVDKITGLHLGIDDYVTKPFDPEEFLVRIEAILKKKKFYESISMTDGLTGLYNIHFFKKQLDLMFKMAKRTGQEFSLAVLDVNDFKEINDVHGHAVGDYVLKSVADALKEELRKSDIITRYGGDEFTIILPKLNGEQAEHVIRKIQKKIKSREFISPKSEKKFKVTISAGAATWKQELESPAELFEEADERMYEDKNSGKKDKGEHKKGRDE
ncbi:MAG: diguanylate cyclase [Elusimicrobia bacterium]|nr:diguanylate cyclase [Elusimicrobiota bacterium]